VQIVEEPCPECGRTFIVDRTLWSIGTVRLRCPSCGARFLPAGSPGTTTLEEATAASVPISLWDPETS
jgi:DNA-directed RNA polymerase subunit RPC12/RpoP